MRIEGNVEVVLTNVLGDEVKIYMPHPSDNPKNYDLAGKYLTSDCSTCPAFIPKDEAVELLNLGTREAWHKWTPPDPDSVKGACVWRGQKKLLYQRPKGAIHCGLLKKP